MGLIGSRSRQKTWCAHSRRQPWMHQDPKLQGEHVTLNEILNIVGIDVGLLAKTSTHGLVNWFGGPTTPRRWHTSRFCNWVYPMPATHSRNMETWGFNSCCLKNKLTVHNRVVGRIGVDVSCTFKHLRQPKKLLEIGSRPMESACATLRICNMFVGPGKTKRIPCRLGKTKQARLGNSTYFTEPSFSLHGRHLKNSCSVFRLHEAPFFKTQRNL